MDEDDEQLEDVVAKGYIEYTTRVKGHKCNLLQAEHPIVNYIYHGLFVDFRRKVRLMMLLNPDDPDSKAKLRSTAKMREDQEHHLKYYYYMIHPYSRARGMWETLMILAYTVEFIVIPFDMALRNPPTFIVLSRPFSKTLLMIDCVLWFFTGYYDEALQKVVLNPRKTASLYLKTYFIPDFLSCVPYGIILWYMGKHRRPYTHVKTAFVLRIFRVPTYSTYLQRFLERHDAMSALNLKVLRATLSMIIILAWAVGFRFYMRAFPAEVPRSEYMFVCLLETVSKLMLVGTGSTEKSYIVLLLKDIFFLTSGAFLTKYMLLQVMDIYKRKSGSRHQYETTMVQIDEYMKYKNIPPNLKIRIYHYLDFRFQKQIYNEEDLLSVLSTPLVHQILLHKCQELVENVSIFKDLPTSIVLKIITKLRLETYLPKDIIVQAGTQGNAMYFISAGRVAVYSIENEELCHMVTFDHFGEIALVTKRPRVGTVIAVDECEMYRLSRKDFQEVMTPYPENYAKVKRLAMDRLETVEHQVATQSNVSAISVLF